MTVVGEAADGLIACEQVPALKPDVVVMDVSMPGLSGSQATARLKQECPTVRVVALTVHEDKLYIRQHFEAGATGYVLKRAAPEELILAIRAVAKGNLCIDPSLAAKVVGGYVRNSSKAGTPSGGLSERETQVARWTAAGHGIKEIAVKFPQAWRDRDGTANEAEPGRSLPRRNQVLDSDHPFGGDGVHVADGLANPVHRLALRGPFLPRILDRRFVRLFASPVPVRRVRWE